MFKQLESNVHTRIVFAQVKDNLGGIMYRLKGKYILDKDQTSEEKGLVWKRVATRVPTIARLNPSLEKYFIHDSYACFCIF